MRSKQMLNALQAKHDAAEQKHLVAGAALDRALDKLATAHIAYRSAHADAGGCCEDCGEALWRTAHDAWEARDDALHEVVLAKNAHAEAVNAWGPLHDRLKAFNDPNISVGMH